MILKPILNWIQLDYPVFGFAFLKPLIRNAVLGPACAFVLIEFPAVV